MASADFFAIMKHAYDHRKGMDMKRTLAALFAGLLTATAAAQTSPPTASDAERQRDVAKITEANSGSSASTQKTAAQQSANVKASKHAPKLSKQEKEQFAKDATKLNVNPENSAGTAATARMQKQTTALSKEAGRRNTELKTKEGKAQLEKELQQKSSP
jgi:hypothetical protein